MIRDLSFAIEDARTDLALGRPVDVEALIEAAEEAKAKLARYEDLDQRLLYFEVYSLPDLKTPGPLSDEGRKQLLADLEDLLAFDGA